MTKRHKIEIRITPEDKAVIQAAADAKGVTVSRWIRAVALRAAKACLRQKAPIRSGHRKGGAPEDDGRRNTAN